MDYKIIEDHTADIGFKVTAETLPAAFEKSAFALTDIMTDVAKIDAKRSIEIDLTSEDLESLLFDFLTELLYKFDTDGFVSKEVHVQQLEKSDGSYKLTANISGDTFDLKKHDAKMEIKAITYHQMKIEKKENKWHIQVIVDI